MKKLSFGFVSVLTVVIFLSTANGQTRINQDWEAPLQKCWKHPLEGISGEAGASDNEGLLLVPANWRSLFALDVADGTEVWLKDVTNLNSNIAINQQTIFLSRLPESTNSDLTKDSLLLENFDLNSGLTSLFMTVERLRAPSTTNYISSFGTNSLLIGNDGLISEFDLKTKNIRNEIDIGKEISTFPASSQKFLWLGTKDGMLSQIGQVPLALIREIPLGFSISSLVTSSGRVYVGDEKGVVRSIVEKTGVEAWKARTGGKIVNIKVISQGILVSSNDNYVYLLSHANGKKLWKRKMSGRIVGAGLVGDKYGAFVSNSSSEVLIIDLDTGKIVNRVGLDSNELYVAPPLELKGRLILLTGSGVTAYSSGC